MLDIDAAGSSPKGGLLVPRLTTAERNAITAPIPMSLLIFNTTTECFEAWNQTSSAWVAFGCISCQLPGAFTATAASGITATTFASNWVASASATTYYLDVATDAAFTSFVSGYNNLNVGNVVTTNVTGLTCATTYYYRLRASNSCGTSANSNTFILTTSPCCAGGSQTSGCGGLTTMTDSRDGKVYNIVQTGTGTSIQCWMAENLNYGTYSTLTGGAQIPGTKYCQNLSGASDPSCPFGGLYQWTEMMKGSGSCNGDATCPPCTTPIQGVCPVGWHIPSHYEWTLLEKNVGSNPGAFPYDISTIGPLGTDEGGNLKQIGTTNWTTPNTGATNTSGFTALPNGNGGPSSFGGAGLVGYWWSATDNFGDAWSRSLNYNTANVVRANNNNKINGFSVRCLKN